MKKADNIQTSTGETVTISRTEYEKFQGQEQQLLALNERLAQMEQRIEGLMEARVWPITSGLVPLPRSRKRTITSTLAPITQLVPQ